MSAITISREAGSRGDWIAREVARLLDYRLVDKNTFEHIFTQFGFIDFRETYDQSGFWARFDPHVSEMADLLKQASMALVSLGRVVLVGRGGFGRFKDYADVLNVRIQAPFGLRVQRAAEELRLPDLSLAEEYVIQSDRQQHHFLESVYGPRWKTLDFFDLLIDTGKISAPEAADWLVEAGSRLGENMQAGLATTRDLPVDPVMLRAVAEVLQAAV